MDLYILNEINKLKSGGGGGGAASSFGVETPVNGKQTIAGFTAVNDRYYHQSMDWASSINGRTYYAYAGGGASDYYTPCMALEFLRGNGRTDNVQPVIQGNNISNRRLVFAKHDDLGLSTTQQWAGRSASNYNPVGVTGLFIRNPTNSDVTKTAWWTYTNYWSAGYEGSSCWIYTPNNTAYSATTGGTWTNLHSRSSGNSEYDTNFSITVPANKTVILLGINSAWYTNSWSYYTEHMMNNKFYNLRKQTNSIFDGTLVSDMRMTQAFQQADMYGVTGYPTATNPQADWAYTYYNRTADFFGDR